MYRTLAQLLNGSRLPTVRAQHGTDIEIRHRRPIVEIRPSGVSKASAIDSLMLERPFRGRHPICLGDNSCDEAAFEYAIAAGGLSVALNIKRPTAASAQLPSIGDTRGWLHGLGAYLGSARMRSSNASRVAQIGFRAAARSVEQISRKAVRIRWANR